MLHKEPEFSSFFIHRLLVCNVRIEEDLVDQLFNLSEKRLARILLLLVNLGEEGQPNMAIPSITQENLVEMIEQLALEQFEVVLSRGWCF